MLSVLGCQVLAVAASLVTGKLSYRKSLVIWKKKNMNCRVSLSLTNQTGTELNSDNNPYSSTILDTMSNMLGA